MSRKKTQKVISTTAVVFATILAWLSGFFVMQIVYNSIAAEIVFASVWATIVFFESRFSYISLKSDGKITITKEEVKSNFWQIVAATLVAILVAIPLMLKIYESTILEMIGSAGNDLGGRLMILGDIFPTNWLPMVLMCLLVVVIYQLPIFLRMASGEK